MPTITGTDGNDTLVGSSDADTFYPLLGGDTVNGLGGSDTLIVDYSHAPYDPYGGAGVPGDLISSVWASGGALSGSITGGGAGVNFSNIELLQVTLNFWSDRFVIDAAALALGASIWVDGGKGIDTLQLDLSALASTNIQTDPVSFTTSFGTFLNFEKFVMNLTEGVDTVTTGAGNDTLTGNGGNDVLNSGSGHDVLSGGAGSNILNAGDGDDQLSSTGSDTADGGAGYDIWSGNYGSLTTAFSMTRDRAAGTATLSVGTTLTGIERIAALVTGSGNDVFVFNGLESISIDAGAGLDRLTFTSNGFSSELKADGVGAFKGFFGYERFTGIEFLTLTSQGVPDVISVDAAPLLAGATLSLDAAGGSDTLIIDLIAYASISFVVAADGTLTTNVPATFLNFENYQVSATNQADNIITGAGQDMVYGNGGDDVIGTGSGNDLLDGGAGADSMTGGAGDDIYIVGDANDTITEQTGGGSDEIRTSLASFSIAAIAHVESLTGTSDAGQTLTGNALANNITGGAGNDYLIGLGGADFLQGKMGNDTYLVEDAAASVYEVDGWGTDTVYTTVSYVLTAYVEVEMLAVHDQATTYAIDLTGSNRNQSIFGNAGANLLTGGGGTDVMHGLGGDDTYIVDSANDQVIEASSQGSDTILTFVSYTLASALSVETLSAHPNTGFTSLALIGNELGQKLIGNTGNNVIDGGGGADTMIGGDGSDVYFVDADDIVTENANGGLDEIRTALTSYTLAAQVENLTGTSTGGQRLTGNDGDNLITGQAGDDWLEGGTGNDRLVGGLGHDELIGGSGADRFVFTRTADSRSAMRSDGWKKLPDIILDFQSGEDRVDLAAIDAITGTAPNNPFTFIGTAAFGGHAGELRYESRSGGVLILADTDGNGIADFMLTALGVSSLAASDFIL